MRREKGADAGAKEKGGEKTLAWARGESSARGRERELGPEHHQVQRCASRADNCLFRAIAFASGGRHAGLLGRALGNACHEPRCRAPRRQEGGSAYDMVI